MWPINKKEKTGMSNIGFSFPPPPPRPKIISKITKMIFQVEFWTKEKEKQIEKQHWKLIIEEIEKYLSEDDTNDCEKPKQRKDGSE